VSKDVFYSQESGDNVVVCRCQEYCENKNVGEYLVPCSLQLLAEACRYLLQLHGSRVGPGVNMPNAYMQQKGDDSRTE
jgi:hypothetical protein